MARRFLYKMTSIAGAAPCVEDGLLSLAICKPMIRRTAQVGDLLVGVAANSAFADNRLVYVARVTGKLEQGAYYRERAYRQRPDCIYEWAGGRFDVRDGALFHGTQDELAHDIGPHPGYARAHTLLSTEFRYFGRDGTTEYRSRHPHLANAVNRLGRGHRVNHGQAVEREIEALFAQLMREAEPATTRTASSLASCGQAGRRAGNDKARSGKQGAADGELG